MQPKDTKTREIVDTYIEDTFSLFNKYINIAILAAVFKFLKIRGESELAFVFLLVIIFLSALAFIYAFNKLLSYSELIRPSKHGKLGAFVLTCILVGIGWYALDVILSVADFLIHST